MKTTLFGISLLSALPYAAAHGYLRQIAIAGKVYRGNIPNVSNFPSPIRAIDDPSPVKGATNRAVNCGQNAKIAELVADANPGDELTFDWAGGDNGKWPHNTGPMLTYLASCGNTTCDKFDAINAKWFKIDEVGQKPNSAKWFQEDIMAGDTYSTHLPANLASGDYLVRHEIIGLHIANVVGGAEFYPSCTQIRVAGNQTGQPDSDSNSNSTVSLPGAYVDNSKSLVGNFFDPIDYEFPGPAIDPKLASGGVAITNPAPKTDGQPDPTASATASSSKATQTADDDDDDDDCEDEDDGETSTTVSSNTSATATISTSTSSTFSAASTSTASANNAVVSGSSQDTGYSYRPRRISRIMRREYPHF